jgi:hypothetical protein
LNTLRTHENVPGLVIVRRLKDSGLIIRTKFTAHRHVISEFRLLSLRRAGAPSTDVLTQVVRLLCTQVRHKFNFALPEEQQRNLDTVLGFIHSECERVAPFLEQAYRSALAARGADPISDAIEAMTTRWFTIAKAQNEECMDKTPLSVCKRVVEMWDTPTKHALSGSLLTHALLSAQPPTVLRLVGALLELPLEQTRARPRKALADNEDGEESTTVTA